MTPKSIKNVLFISLFGVYLVLQACVPARQLEDSKEREKKCNEENTRLKDANRLTGDSLKEFKSKADALRAAGWRFYTFIGQGGCRFMCAWDTTEQDVRDLVAALRAVA